MAKNLWLNIYIQNNERTIIIWTFEQLFKWILEEENIWCTKGGGWRFIRLDVGFNDWFEELKIYAERSMWAWKRLICKIQKEIGEKSKAWNKTKNTKIKPEKMKFLGLMWKLYESIDREKNFWYNIKAIVHERNKSLIRWLNFCFMGKKNCQESEKTNHRLRENSHKTHIL